MGRRARVVLLVLWFIGISIPLATLAVQHDLPFAVRVGSASPRTNDTQSTGVTPSIRHVLAADCECSKAVGEGLIARRAAKAEREQVWIVGRADALRQRLERAGYDVLETSAEETIKRLDIVGAPLLIVYSPSGDVPLYAGGYDAQRPRRPDDIKVDAIVRLVRAGKPAPPYPAYGCIVGQDLRRQVDPLGLKYGSANTSAS